MKSITLLFLSLSITAISEPAYFISQSINTFAPRPLMPNCETPMPVVNYGVSQCYTTTAKPSTTPYPCEWVADQHASKRLKPVYVNNEAYYKQCSPAYNKDTGPQLLLYLDGDHPKQEDACIVEPHASYKVLLSLFPRGTTAQLQHCGGQFANGQWTGGVACPTNSYCLMQIVHDETGVNSKTIYQCSQPLPYPPNAPHSKDAVQHIDPSSIVMTTDPYQICNTP